MLNLSSTEIQEILKALQDTLYMTFVSLFLACIIGLFIGIILFCTSSNGLFKNRVVNRIVDLIVNILRAIPFIILLVILMPLTKIITGSVLGIKAAIPSLVCASAPFFARMCVIAFNEVDKGTIEASKAMGATNTQIIFKVLLPESVPALISGISVTGINLVGYTAMAGAIGSGGLGNLAWLYGFSRHNDVILYTATIIVVIIVFIIQFFGDYTVKKTDKR